MTSIELTDAQHRALFRVCQHYLRMTALVELPNSAMIEERAIAKRVVDGPGE